MTITSTSGWRSSRRSAAITCSAACGPWTRACRTSSRTAGQRRRAFSTTSRSAALSAPVTRPDRPGQERQRALPGRVEQSLDLQQPLGLLQLGQQPALADRRDRVAVVAEPAGLLEVRGLEPGDHGRALGQRTGRVEGGGRDGDRGRDLGQLVPQGQEDGPAGAAADLDQLGLDPDRTQPVDPAADHVGDQPQRLRVLRRGLQGHSHERRAPGRVAGRRHLHSAP